MHFPHRNRLDVKVITPEGLVADDKLDQIARDFNTKNLRIIREGEYAPLVLSKSVIFSGKKIRKRDVTIFIFATNCRFCF